MHADAARGLRLALHVRSLAHGAGGMERTAINLANLLSGRGWQTGLFYRDRPDAHIIYPVDPGVELHPVAYRHDGPDAMADAVARWGADVALFLSPDCTGVDHVRALAARGVPVALHEATNPERLLSDGWARRKGITLAEAAQEREALGSLCARLRVTLPPYRDSFGPYLRPHVHAFPNAFAPALPTLEALRGAPRRRRFINIGGLKRVKNLLPAVDAFLRVAPLLPDWDLAVFSHDPGLGVRESVEARTSAHPEGGRVHLLPATPAIYDEYARSDVHVISSRSEGLPSCVAEAMLHGMPSVGFRDCPGTNALIEDGRNGLLVDPADEAGGLAAAMLRLGRDDALREAMGRAALEDAAIFHPDAIVLRWEALLREAASYRGDLGRAARERAAFDPDAPPRLATVRRAAFAEPPAPLPARAARRAGVARLVAVPPGRQPGADDIARLRAGLDPALDRLVLASGPPEGGEADWATRVAASADPASAWRGALAAAGEGLVEPLLLGSAPSAGLEGLRAALGGQDVACGLAWPLADVEAGDREAPGGALTTLARSPGLLCGAPAPVVLPVALAARALDALAGAPPGWEEAPRAVAFGALALAEAVRVLPAEAPPPPPPLGDAALGRLAAATAAVLASGPLHGLRPARQAALLAAGPWAGLEAALRAGADVAALDALRRRLALDEGALDALALPRPEAALALAALRAGLLAWVRPLAEGRRPDRHFHRHLPAGLLSPGALARGAAALA